MNKEKPNIVFILMDDLGWRDLSCYGSDFYETPNIDQLASDSMLFTNAYASAPVCSPTRASIVTGKYPARLGLTNYISTRQPGHRDFGHLVDAPYVPHLNPRSQGDRPVRSLLPAVGQSRRTYA